MTRSSHAQTFTLLSFIPLQERFYGCKDAKKRWGSVWWHCAGGGGYSSLGAHIYMAYMANGNGKASFCLIWLCVFYERLCGGNSLLWALWSALTTKSLICKFACHCFLDSVCASNTNCLILYNTRVLCLYCYSSTLRQQHTENYFLLRFYLRHKTIPFYLLE